MFHANILGRITRLFCSMPVLVCTVHNLRETSERGGSTGWKELLYRITDRLATRTTIICQAAFDRYVEVRAVPAKRLEMIPNGIDVNAFHPDTEARARARQALGIDNQFVWLAVGRMVHQKDYPNLFRALALLPISDYTVLIAGNGPLEDELRAECQRLGLNRQVRFLGVREDIRDLYNAADAYVMSSEFEGFSMALLEAACTELPIVATDAGGNREIVQNGVTGHIVPPQNPAELAAAMGRVMNASQDERLATGKAARSYCLLHFQIHIVMEKWVQLFARYTTGTQLPLGSMLHSTQSEQRGSIS
jgi:glycosyltransferase involved in cell wall biosynthesis